MIFTFDNKFAQTDEADNPKPYFGEYPTDYFDFIIIDECHRGGANDEDIIIQCCLNAFDFKRR
jgi:type I restriction enzyme R subunit